MSLAASTPDDFFWRQAASEWSLRSDAVYLNHGSFGPPPRVVVEARRRFQTALDEEPMDFYVRQYEPAWFAARERLAAFVGTRPGNLVFVENATAGMNVVAESSTLGPGDRVVLNDHEYGAVIRIWERACRRAGAEPPVVARLPKRLDDVGEVVDSLFRHVDARTRLLVVSHVTSATATILPVAEIAAEARRRGVPLCVDGPHALLQCPVAIDELGVDWYTASCHKWLCAPFGSGFLYASARRQTGVVPANLSWGRIHEHERKQWFDEFVWTGTRDSSPYLAIPAAIEFFERLGVDRVRARLNEQALYARRKLVETLRTEPIMVESWIGSMAHVPLPDSIARGRRGDELRGAARRLQQWLWDSGRMEVPIVAWNDRLFVRVSCHLYNVREQVDDLAERLVEATRREF